MRRKYVIPCFPFAVVCGVLLWSSATAAQEVTINGIVAHGTNAVLNVTVDVIEYRQGKETHDAPVHLITGKKHYGVAVVSSVPLLQLDTELLWSTTVEHPFTVTIEDGREFGGCVVTGLKTIGPDTAPRLSYALTCESISLPRLQCASGCQAAY